MGSGKSSGAINLMNKNKDVNYIYITPYKDEVERIIEKTDNKFYQPMVYTKNEETFFKKDSLNSLLSHNKNIATTHALFKMADEETRDLLYAGKYVLILDEVIEVVRQVNLKEKDINMLFNSEWLIQDGYKLKWNIEKEEQEGEYDGDKFQVIRKYALNGNLIKHNDNVLLWTLPIEMFQVFEDAYILTYLFESSILKYYLDMHKINYTKYIATNKDNYYYFTPKGDHTDKEYKQQLKQLLNIYEGDLNKIGDKPYSLSFTWYDKKKHMHKKLKNNVLNFFQNISKTKSNYNMWTTFKDYEHKIKGKGYTKGFISISIKATNEYQHKTALAYTVNRYLSPSIDDYFSKNNIDIDEDLVALGELVQWIFRSTIRNGNPIHIYIPSSRMRNLLYRWLDDEL